MSKRQKDACAARLAPAKAAEFLDLLAASDSLFATSVRLRRKAWELYRQEVPDDARALRLVSSKPPGGGHA